MIAAMLIRAFERTLGEDMSYMHDIAAVSGKAFRGFARVSMFAAYRRHAPKSMIHLTRLGAMAGEDCGPCTRIAFKVAKREGVDEPLLRAALAGGEALSGDAAEAFFFGHAISTGDVVAADEHGAAIEASHGRKVRTELALAAATTRIFPAVKRGLGYAKSCELTRFEDL